MSFDRLNSLESQPATSTGGYSDDPNFSNRTAQLSNGLFRLTSSTSTLNQQLALLGTPKDSEAVRNRVAKLLTETRDGFRSITDGLKKLSHEYPDSEVSPAMKYQLEKISKQLANSLADFQATQRLAAEKTRRYVNAAKAVAHGGQTPEGEDVPLVNREYGSEGNQQLLVQEESQRLANQDDVDYQEEMIRTREIEIREIEAGVRELNDIFKDLGEIVADQGSALDIISDNVGRTEDHQRAAADELRSAARYQKGARNRMCCLLLILAVILTIVLLAVS